MISGEVFRTLLQHIGLGTLMSTILSSQATSRTDQLDIVSLPHYSSFEREHDCSREIHDRLDFQNAWGQRADATVQPVPYRPIRPLRCNPSFSFFILGFEGCDRSLSCADRQSLQ